MAIAAGSLVLPSGALIIPNAVGPIQGFVVSGTGPFVVQWANTESAAAAAALALDLITLDPTVADELVGRQVRPTSPAGQTNYGRCICVAVYKRDPGGAGNAVHTYALLVNLTTYTYFEVLASAVEVVP